MRWELLVGVPEEDVRELIAASRRRGFRREEILFHEHDPADSLHLISKGRVAVRRTTAAGRTVTFAVRTAGDVVGELALIGDPPTRTATVAALEPTETFAVSRTSFDEMRARHPSLNALLVTILTQRVRELDDRLTEAMTMPADVRIRRRLLDLRDAYGGDGSPIPIGQEALAELAGTTRATVNRVLKEEEARGTIALGRARVTVLDADGLGRRARG